MRRNLNRETLLELENSVLKSPGKVIEIEDYDFFVVEKQYFTKVCQILNELEKCKGE